MNIEFHPLARLEADEAAIYYDTEQPGTGTRFLTELSNKLAQIAESPLLFGSCGAYRRANLKVFPYYIAFTIEVKAIRVWAIAHAKRRPNYWAKRMKK
jgi:hypothetical protein